MGTPPAIPMIRCLALLALPPWWFRVPYGKIWQNILAVAKSVGAGGTAASSKMASDDIGQSADRWVGYVTVQCSGLIL